MSGSDYYVHLFPQLRGTFTHMYLKQLDIVLRTNDRRGIRYFPELLALGDAVLTRGGPAMVNLLRGPVDSIVKGEPLPSRIDQVCIILPSVKTINNHRIPANPGNTLTPAIALKLKVAIVNAHNSNPKMSEAVPEWTILYGTLQFDEVDAKRSLYYHEEFQCLSGFKGGVIGANGIMKRFPADITGDALFDLAEEQLGTHIMQVFFTPINGWGTWPIDYFVTSGFTKEELVSRIEGLTWILRQAGLLVVGTSSDGGGPILDALNELRSVYGYWIHIFDYSHLLKLLRNTLRDSWMQEVVTDPLTGKKTLRSPFSLQTLRELYSAPAPIGSVIRGSIELRYIDPDDVMAMKPVTQLLRDILITALKDVCSMIQPEDHPFHKYLEPLEGLTHYLQMMKKLYEAFYDQQSFQASFLVITEVNSYFQSLNFTRSSKVKVMEHLDITRASLFKLSSPRFTPPAPNVDPNLPNPLVNSEIIENRKAYLADLVTARPFIRRMATLNYIKLSCISTLVVEHLFSLIRAIEDTLSIEKYDYAFQRAMADFRNRLTTKEAQLFPQSEVGLSTAYPQRSGVLFPDADGPISIPERKKLRKDILDQYKGDQAGQQRCRELAALFPPETHQLHLRETYKSPPTIVDHKKSGKRLQCKICLLSGEKARAYLSDACLANHFLEKSIPNSSKRPILLLKTSLKRYATAMMRFILKYFLP